MTCSFCPQKSEKMLVAQPESKATSSDSPRQQETLQQQCSQQEFVSFFEESERFLSTLELLCEAIRDANCVWDLTHDRHAQWIRLTVDKYQEQPQLLDPHLEAIVQPLIGLLRDLILNSSSGSAIDSNGKGVESTKDLATNEFCDRLGPVFQVLYWLCKARGYKTILKFFSHDVSDLEPLLEFIEGIKEKGIQLRYWETTYILLLWLSLVCMIPFDLSTVDSRRDASQPCIAERILDVAKHYLVAVQRDYEAASVLLMRVLTRKDVSNKYLSSTVKDILDSIKASENSFELRGWLNALCTLFKYGSRSMLLPTLPLTHIAFDLEKDCIQQNQLLRKLQTKLCQRLGLCYMRPRVASWRYERGFRSLLSNLAPDSKPADQPQRILQDEEYDDIPDVIEDILDLMLRGLRDRDTVVRWVAAKGIGRITNRLPKELADEVVVSVISVLQEDILNGSDLRGVSDASWHGACLALAELSRRGLLLPERLPQVIPWIVQAIKFDQRRGSHSVGTHVRDAACYVCWSFARAYAPDVMAPYVEQLAHSLVIVSVFDREINIRRASSAAFQENVGRQGNFPHGIDILTAADYFTVGNRSRAYLDVSLEIAKFSEYRHDMIDHLSDVSIAHWDKNMRELASQTLAKFVHLDMEYISQTCLPKLMKNVRDKDLVVRHGSLLGIGEICLAMSQLQNVQTLATRDVLSDLNGLLKDYPPLYLETFGSDLNRLALCRFIQCLALSQWPISEETSKTWLNILETSLLRKEECIQVLAASALGDFSQSYGLNQELLDRLIDLACNLHHGPLNRRGYVLGLGELSEDLLLKYSIPILDSLIKSVKDNPNVDDATTRRNAIQSISKLISRCTPRLSQAIYTKAIETFLEGFEDYSIDSNGDVGSWVREGSIRGLDSLISTLHSQGLTLDSVMESDRQAIFWNAVISNLCRQAVERIDRLRETAGTVLHKILWDVPSVNVSSAEKLRAILPRELLFSWLNAGDVFPVLVPILDIPEYRVEFVKGIMASIGGIAETLIKHSSSSLLDFLKVTSDTNERVTDFLAALVQIFQTYLRMDRLYIPFLNVLELLYAEPSLILAKDISLHLKLFEFCSKILFKSKDIKRLVSGLKVLTSMASLENQGAMKALTSAATKKLAGYLSHPFPLIRRSASEQAYLVVTAHQLQETESTEALDECEELLLSTNWDQPVSECKVVKETILALLCPS